MCVTRKTKFGFNFCTSKIDSRTSIETSIESSTSFTTSRGSNEIQIDVLESIFELQKLKNEFRFSGHTHRKGAPANGKSAETVIHVYSLAQSI